eukprot:4838123-Amphidinium_carterae.1
MLCIAWFKFVMCQSTRAAIDGKNVPDPSNESSPNSRYILVTFEAKACALVCRNAISHTEDSTVATIR